MFNYRVFIGSQRVNFDVCVCVCVCVCVVVKVGLCANLRNLVWCGETHSDLFFPRCFLLSSLEEKDSFISETLLLHLAHIHPYCLFMT